MRFSRWQAQQVMKSVIVSLLLALAALLLPSALLASTYGEGDYGAKLFSGWNRTADSTGTAAAAPGCDAPKPSLVPDLFQINTKGEGATLYFAPVPDNRDRYFVSYSTAQTAEDHGFEFLSDSNGVIAVNVNKLQKNTTYYFKVRAGNGCQPGDWSNILSIRSGQLIPSYRWGSLPRVVSTAVKRRTNPSSIGRVADNQRQGDIQPEAPDQAGENNESQIQATPTATPAVRTPQPPAPKQEAPSLLDRFIRLVLKVIGR